MSQLASEGEVLVAPEAEAARRGQRGLALRLGVAAALAVALGLLADLARDPTDPAAERRSWGSSRADGFRASAQLAGRLGHRVVRHRDSWGQLPDPRAHVLLVVDPRPTFAWAQERAAIDASQVRTLGRWVEAGGHLVITPPGQMRLALVELPMDDDETASLFSEVCDATGGPPPALGPAPLAAPLVADPPLALDPGALQPLDARAQLLAAAWLTWNGRPLVLAAPRSGAPELATFDPGGLPAGARARVALGERALVVERDHGAGRVWLLSSAYPLTNLALAHGGAAPFVAGLLHEVTGAGQRGLVLDERAHGLDARRGVLGPLRAAGLGTPLAALLLVALLVAWRGAVREGAPRPARVAPRRAKEEFVVALADLARRAGQHDAAARWLLEAWRERTPAGADAGELEALSGRAAAGGLNDAGLAELAGTLRDAAGRASAATMITTSTTSRRRRP